MPASRRRSAARLAATVLLVLLVSGCAGKAATSTAASTPGTTTSTVAPTTSTVSPSRLTEEAWLNAVTKLHKTIDKPFTASSINMTRAKMVELGNTLAACSRELARIGSPSHRLQPVSVLVKQACRTYDKGAGCFATAARVSDEGGGVTAGSPEERTQKQAMDCSFAAQGDGGNLLGDAEAKGEAIMAAGG
jgi:hypothetical protein